MALEFREGDQLVIQAVLPGCDPDRDISVSIAHDVLHVHASRGTGPRHGEGPSDLQYGSFVRHIALPAGTTEDQVTATYGDGRLEVRVPLGEPVHLASVAIPVTRR
ncbi:Hsp20/alpha crystallin family protein [Acidiferrimicrobium sp. IK]|uniref:Hsp20/alpha crystallin family protein n=1 Tax=Acidiferrimicrobium sp. IK TaxID=2871700 RepID=UPI0021CB6622|nr:Hsp20/alpha crystallin family protein [Acidiferrimicrobium sp. IK]MCU4184461.1 Hsp20/alpha crystallin family protein [Acidiferrimicrobium sp. IK]